MAGTNGSTVHQSVISKVVAIQRSLEVSGPLTVTEIAQTTDLPLSTAHRIVGELTDWQILHRDADGRYSMAPGTGPRGGVPGPREVRGAAAATVADLCSVTRRDVRLGLLQNGRVSYAEKVYGPQPLPAFSPAATLPAHATAVGQVLLAFSPPAVVRGVVERGLQHYTPATLTSAASLDRTLRAIRLRGAAVASGQLRPGHAAVAAPVFGPGPDVIAALEVRLRDIPGELRGVLPALMIAARGLSRRLGHAEAAEPTGTGATVLSLDHPTTRRRRPGDWAVTPGAVNVSQTAD